MITLEQLEKAAMSLENAQANFHRFDAEERAHEQAMIEASEADRALREALATPNAPGEGLADGAAGRQSSAEGATSTVVLEGERN